MKKELILAFIFFVIQSGEDSKFYGSRPLNYWKELDSNPQIDWEKN